MSQFIIHGQNSVAGYRHIMCISDILAVLRNEVKKRQLNASRSAYLKSIETTWKQQHGSEIRFYFFVVLRYEMIKNLLHGYFVL